MVRKGSVARPHSRASLAQGSQPAVYRTAVIGRATDYRGTNRFSRSRPGNAGKSLLGNPSCFEQHFANDLNHRTFVAGNAKILQSRPIQDEFNLATRATKLLLQAPRFVLLDPPHGSNFRNKATNHCALGGNSLAATFHAARSPMARATRNRRTPGAAQLLQTHWKFPYITASLSPDGKPANPNASRSSAAWTLLCRARMSDASQRRLLFPAPIEPAMISSDFPCITLPSFPR
jgi:hypothetical protein